MVLRDGRYFVLSCPTPDSKFLILLPLINLSSRFPKFVPTNVVLLLLWTTYRVGLPDEI